MPLVHAPRSEYADFKAMAPDVDYLVRVSIILRKSLGDGDGSPGISEWKRRRPSDGYAGGDAEYGATASLLEARQSPQRRSCAMPSRQSAAGSASGEARRPSLRGPQWAWAPGHAGGRWQTSSVARRLSALTSASSFGSSAMKRVPGQSVWAWSLWTLMLSTGRFQVCSSHTKRSRVAASCAGSGFSFRNRPRSPPG